ncbi:threonine/serine exporter family protein [Brachybacterium sp. EF45031]|nr:threonine/serine exporter family protein [Brachybacterium sillae]
MEVVTKQVIPGELTPKEGLTRLTAIERADVGTPGIVRLLGWGVMGGGFALLLGGSLLTAVLAALGAAQDLLTGWYLTASARIIEAGLVTGGLVAGVVGGLALAGRFGVGLSVEDTPQPTESLVLTLVASSWSPPGSPWPRRPRGPGSP